MPQVGPPVNQTRTYLSVDGSTSTRRPCRLIDPQRFPFRKGRDIPCPLFVGGLLFALARESGVLFEYPGWACDPVAFEFSDEGGYECSFGFRHCSYLLSVVLMSSHLKI